MASGSTCDTNVYSRLCMGTFVIRLNSLLSMGEHECPQIGSSDVVENVHRHSRSLFPLVNMPDGCYVTICRNVVRNSRIGDWDQKELPDVLS